MNLLFRRVLSAPFNQLFNNNFIKFPFSIVKAKPSKKPQVPFSKWTIVRGDVIKVIAGKDKKKVGKVTRVWRKSNAITVRGVNVKIKRISILFFVN